VHYDGRGLGTSTVELVSLERRTITAVAPARVHLSEGDSGFRRPSEVVWAPDGRRLAFTDLDGTKVVRLPGKHIVRVGPPFGVLTPCSTEDVPTPVWSPDSRRLAFLFAPTYSACNLYVVSASGGRLQAATHFRDFSLDPNTPSWSSDGRRLAATSFPHGDELQTDLRLVDGTRVARLTTTPDAAESDPAYSRTGAPRVLAHERVRRPGRHTASLGGGEGRRPGPRADVGSRRAAPRVRPGRRALRPRGRGGGERMVASGALNASDPAWSPRGDLIVFTNHSARGDTLDVVRADGGELHVLLALPGDSCDAPQGVEQPAWSRDGERLAVVFEVQRRCVPTRDYGTGSIVTMRPDGTDRHVVLDGSVYAPTSDVDAPRRLRAGVVTGWRADRVHAGHSARQTVGCHGGRRSRSGRGGAPADAWELPRMAADRQRFTR